jgi:hypothetical protein
LVRAEILQEIPRKSFAAYTGQAVTFFHPQNYARNGPARPAPDASKEVHHMIEITMTLSHNGRIAMPDFGCVRVADVRALPMGSSAPVAAGWVATAVKTDVQGTTVRAYRQNSDVVLTGAFPGIPAWSPPI